MNTYRIEYKDGTVAYFEAESKEEIRAYNIPNNPIVDITQVNPS